MFRTLKFEPLEMRQLLSATAWVGGNGNWNQASNWTGGLPSATTDVTISPATAATITIQPGEVASVHSLTLGSHATLAMSGGGDPSNPTSNSITNNPDFESPLTSNNTTPPSAWGSWGSAYLSRQYAYTGTQSIVVSGNNSGVTQSFAITPGASCTASVYAMTPASNRLTGSIVAELELLFYNASGTQLSSFSAPNELILLNSSSAPGGPLAGSVGTAGWNHFFTTAVAPSNAATARVQLTTWANSGTTGGAVYFDAVKFGPAAKTSTLTTGSLINSGTITIGAMNKIIDSGGFTQTSTGTLDVQLGGAPATGIFGALTVTGAAVLAGTLKADIVYNYAPSTTDVFIPISYASESGGFAASVLPRGTGYQLAAATSFTNVALSAAPSSTVSTTVNAVASLQSVSPNLMGVNLAWWDTAAVTSQTQQLVAAAGLSVYRLPGGSSSDQFHFNVQNNLGDPVAITLPQFAQFLAAAGGTGMLTVDYGQGSPQEAAAELAYLQGATSDSTTIGNGLEWIGSDTTGQWQTVNWKTAGYWAALRAAPPLAHDDGLNFLRIGHAAPFTGIKYWEIGNEEYGSWEIDHHGTAGPAGVSTGSQHDPATYVAFAKQFATLAGQILAAARLPGISIGIDSGDPTGSSDNSWTKNVLTAGLSIGFVPAYISDHSYMQDPGAENDAFLLNNTVSSPSSILDWSTRYGLYQTLLQQTLASQSAKVQVMATEFNSVNTNPGKQSTSLVNGLFVANSLGSLLTSGYNGSFVWDLRNGWGTTYNNSNLLYGWRKGGDYGLLGPSGQNDAPYADTYIAYPNYYAVQLVAKIINAGTTVVSAASSYSDLDVYAVMQSNGDLDLLVINTNPAAAITSQFSITGFQPAGPAQVWQYGKTEDTAQSLTTNGASALTHTNTTLSLSGASFSDTFPAYSMTVLDLTPAALPLQSNLVVTPAAGTTLSLPKNVSGRGMSLTLNGPGKLILSGTNSYSGGTTVLAGTLVIGSSGALPAGASLTIGASTGSSAATAASSIPVAAPAIAWQPTVLFPKLGPAPSARPTSTAAAKIHDLAILAALEPGQMPEGVDRRLPWAWRMT